MTRMSDDSNKSNDPGSKPPPPERGQDSVNLSIEERGMLAMPVTPDPQGHVQIGGLPTSEGGSGGGEGGGGGAEGDGGSPPPSDSGE